MVVADTKTMDVTGGEGGEGGGGAAAEFETNRIEVLREERSQIQKKTFTKWVNSNLKKKKVKSAHVHSRDHTTRLSKKAALLNSKLSYEI